MRPAGSALCAAFTNRSCECHFRCRCLLLARWRPPAILLCSLLSHFCRSLFLSLLLPSQGNVIRQWFFLGLSMYTLLWSSAFRSFASFETYCLLTTWNLVSAELLSARSLPSLRRFVLTCRVAGCGHSWRKFCSTGYAARPAFWLLAVSSYCVLSFRLKPCFKLTERCAAATPLAVAFCRLLSRGGDSAAAHLTRIQRRIRHCRRHDECVGSHLCSFTSVADPSFACCCCCPV
jgi:hypothetical protein